MWQVWVLMKRKQERSAQNSASPDQRNGEGIAMANVGELYGKKTAAAPVQKSAAAPVSDFFPEPSM